MLLGIWKNFEELEQSISLDELQAILNAAHEREHRGNRFTAAMKGIDIDATSKEENEKRFKASQQRAEAALSGKKLEVIEYDDLGLDFEE